MSLWKHHLDLGFSDELSLQVDAPVIFTGENLFHVAPVWSERGYVSLDHYVSFPYFPGQPTGKWRFIS